MKKARRESHGGLLECLVANFSGYLALGVAGAVTAVGAKGGSISVIFPLMGALTTLEPHPHSEAPPNRL